MDKSRFALSTGLLSLEHKTGDQHQEAAEARGAELIPLHTRSQFSTAIIDVIAGVNREHDFGIAHSHEYKSDILAAPMGRRCSIPIVTTAHVWITNSLKSRFYIWAGKQTLYEHVLSGRC